MLRLSVLETPTIYTSQPPAIYKMRINMVHALVAPRLFPGRENRTEFQFPLLIIRGSKDRDFERAHPGAVNREAILGESNRPAVQNDDPATTPGDAIVAADQRAHRMPLPWPRNSVSIEQLKHLVFRSYRIGEHPPPAIKKEDG